MGGRIATLRIRGTAPGSGAERGDLRARLTRALLAGSPRIALAGPRTGRLDARGWERRGGEEELARRLLRAADGAGLPGAGVGVADVAVAADAAARMALETVGDTGAPAVRIVPAGGSRSFLAPLPLRILPLPDEMQETLGALGLRRVGELADLDRGAVEARFGPPGLRAHRWARGEDDRVFPLRPPEAPPGASLELEGSVGAVQPLLFVLRQLLHRLCGDLEAEGRSAARLRLTLGTAEGEDRTEEIVPARPTRREDLLLDLCRAALERTGDGDRLPAPVTRVSLRAVNRAAPETRQGDLFAADPRDPGRAAAALSRLRARLGPDAVARPLPREDHRPEARNRWAPVEETEGPPSGGDVPGRGRAGPLPGTRRLLPEPVPLRVECREGRPSALRDARGRHEVTATEGPERISGDWWEAPYAREYWWAATGEGELLWIFREHRGEREPRWRLHGWWD